MRKSVFVLPLLASSIIAAVAGCKTENGAGPAGPASSVSCGALYDAYDAYDAKCAPAESISDRAGFLKVCELALAAPGGSGASAPTADCASAVQSLTATCGSTNILACKLSGGLLLRGAACGTDVQCASALCKDGGVFGVLAGDVLTLTAHCGVCSDPRPIGGGCGAAETCADHGVCSGDTCVAVVKNDVGGHCSRGTTPDQCKEGLYCGTDQKCKPPSGSGGDCVQDTDCNYPLACSNMVCADPKPAGATCDPSSPVAGCARELVCDHATKRCAAVTRVKPGGTCDNDGRVCALGRCALPNTSPDGGVPTGTCPAVLNEGDACSTMDLDKTCGDFLYCIGAKCVYYDPGMCK